MVSADRPEAFAQKQPNNSTRQVYALAKIAKLEPSLGLTAGVL